MELYAFLMTIIFHHLKMQFHKYKICTNTNIHDIWSKLSTSLFPCQGKWQTWHLKCMNILCNTQQCSSPSSWRIHPWGHSDWHSWAKLWSHTQLPVSLQDEKPEVLTRPGFFFPGVNQADVSMQDEGSAGSQFLDWGQRRRDYTTNPMFVWHQ